MFKELFQRIGTTFSSEVERPIDIPAFEKIISYTFKNKELLLKALKHRSYLNISNEESHHSNERLEFLGDAVLDLIVTEHLYNSFEKESEGSLSKKKSVLVSRQVLGDVINSLDLGKYLLLNYGEEKTGGRQRHSNLANLFESILGAIYLDSGYKQAKQFVDRFLLKKRDEFLNGNSYYNYKSTLLELAQSRGWGFPKYEVLEESGPDHSKHFTVSVKVKNGLVTQGQGKSKKKAEQTAARIMLEKLKKSNKKNGRNND